MRVAVLTNFNDLNPGYSLTGIVTDQLRMLLAYGHDVHLFTSERYDARFDDALPPDPELVVHHTLPQRPLHDYQSRQELTAEGREHVELLVPFLRQELDDFDVAFTHDWIFTGWNLPYALAIEALRDDLRHVGFMHWIHSIPTGEKDWWNLANYGFPAWKQPDCWAKNHRIISPSMINIQHLAEEFRCTSEEVRCVPHIKDPRTWFEFGPDTCAFLDDHPGVMQADVLQVYPASCDRLAAKQLHHLIAIFAAFKRRCLRVCLICANQWASRYAHKESIDAYYEMADALHLTTARNKPGQPFAEEFLFTSEWRHPQFELGLPKRMLRELMQLSNLFVFPTNGESFGLVAPEAALCGNHMVLNRDVEVLAENFVHQGAYFSFGSESRHLNPDSWERYLDNVAGAILARMRRNEVTMTKTYARQRFNWDMLYHKAYDPIMRELVTCRD
jgi:glycosyltransferase involved in cell wall biosynthesis